MELSWVFPKKMQYKGKLMFKGRRVVKHPRQAGRMVDYTSHIPSRGRGSSLEFGLALWIISVDRTRRNIYLVSFWPSSLSGLSASHYPFLEASLFGSSYHGRRKDWTTGLRGHAESPWRKREDAILDFCASQLNWLYECSQSTPHGGEDEIFPLKVCPDWKNCEQISGGYLSCSI